MVKRYFFASPPAAVAKRESSIKPGTTLPLSSYDWTKSERSLVFVLSTDCRFCTESESFYKRITTACEGQKKIRLVAVLPQDVEVSRRYLDKLGVGVDEIKQAPPLSLGAAGTPTLVLVDSKGVVLKSWAGKVPAAIEAEVLAMITQS